MFRKFSLKGKMSLFISVIVLIMFAITTTLNILELSTQLKNDLKKELKSVGILTTNSIDREDIQYLTTNSSGSDEIFKKTQEKLDDIMEKQGVMSWSYIWKMNGDSVVPIAFTKNLDEIYKAGENFTDLADIHLKAATKAMETNQPVVTKIFDDPFGTWETVFTPIVDENNNPIAVLGVDYSADYINNIIQKSLIKEIAIAIIGIIILIIVIYFSIRKLLKPLDKVISVANNVAEGNLSDSNLDLNRKDEIGVLSNSIQSMIDSLRNLIHNIKLTSEHLAASSEELSATASEGYHFSKKVSDEIKDVVSSTNNTLLIMEESAQAMTESSDGIYKIAQSSSVVSEVSQETLQQAEEGNKAIKNVVDQMEKINNSVTHLSHAIKQLGVSSGEIGSIVNIITEIADQTNLLALNAAIEAARAGEHGRGFAVVAEEVRKLAEQSAQSAQQIHELINEIQKDTESSISVMEQGKEDVQYGIELTKEAGNSFEEILTSTRNVASQIQEVSAASEQVSATTEEVSASVEQLKEYTVTSADNLGNVSISSEEQAASIEEISRATHSLSEKAEELQQLVSSFKL
ncbi:methyl-accepting chemotaxis protein [Heyndrickxia sp. FSL K6-6286]|uniref:methyl-accepting chemotaxis protein n=1 Tax=Heyndrickxia sp. FSL K6-6286 TaxID=2921510 RepID=UPI00315995F9